MIEINVSAMGYPAIQNPIPQPATSIPNFQNLKGKVVPLMAVMFCVLLFNPFQLFQFTSSSSEIEGPQKTRALLSVNFPDVSSWPNVIPWILMTIFAILWLISRRKPSLRGIPEGAYPGEASRQLSEAMNDLVKQDVASAEYHLMECRRLMKVPELGQKSSFATFVKEVKHNKFHSEPSRLA